MNVSALDGIVTALDSSVSAKLESMADNLTNKYEDSEAVGVSIA